MNSAFSNLITIKNCRIHDSGRVKLPRLDWEMKSGEAWLVIGPNGGGKAEFIKGLEGQLEISPNELTVEQLSSGQTALYSSAFSQKGSIAIVSLEKAASLIEEERQRDESEIMDKEDEGRTGRQYICEVLGGSSKKGAPLPPIASRLETMPQIKLCGVEKILDRGLRYMSTGEIRRTLLCRALLSGAGLLILSDPFAGLDAESRRILLEFFNTIAKRQLSLADGSEFPRIILSMERWHEIPDAINRVIEFTEKKISFCGSREEYEKIVETNKQKRLAEREEQKHNFLAELNKIRENNKALSESINNTPLPPSLIKFEDVLPATTCRFSATMYAFSETAAAQAKPSGI